MNWLNKPRFMMPRFTVRHLTLTGLIGILIILFIATYAILNYFIHGGALPNDPSGKIREEIVQSLLNILVATLIGGTVAALFKAYERNIERTKLHTQLKLDFIKRIGELYRLAKKIRRKLKEGGITINGGKLIVNEKQYQFYSSQMDILNDVQLEIEGFKIAADNSFLFPRSKLIVPHLDRMEVYLNKIHGEYEDLNPKINLSGSIDLNDFYLLKEFTDVAGNRLLTPTLKKKYKLTKYEPAGQGEDTHYCFKNIFSRSYTNLLKTLGQVLL